MEFPELLEFGEALLQGKHVEVVRKWGTRANWLGVFRPGDLGTRVGRVQLLARIFRLIQPEEESRMAAAAAEWAKENPVAGRKPEDVAAERYRHEYEALLEQRKREQPLLASKVLAHEIGHVWDYLPQQIVRGRGNLLGHIAAFENYVMRSLTMLPADQGSLLTERERERIRREAERDGRGGARPRRRSTRTGSRWRGGCAGS
jgi:hypothetical protein